jgi:thioredoxin 1
MIFDAPIHTNDSNLNRVLTAGLPVLLAISEDADSQIEQALAQAAQTYSGKLLVVRVQASANPQTMATYNHPALPALITLRGGKVRERIERATADYVRWIAADLLGETTQARPQPPKTQAPALPVHVTDGTFSSEVLESPVPVLVDFWAAWCGPCRMIAPSLEQLAQQYGGKVKIAKLNVDENPRMAQRFEAHGIPMLLLFKGGQPIGKLVGAHPKPSIEKLINLSFG